jgi:hypothetical protein
MSAIPIPINLISEAWIFGSLQAEAMNIWKQAGWEDFWMKNVTAVTSYSGTGSG